MLHHCPPLLIIQQALPHALASSLALYITTLSSSPLLRQVCCRWLFISDVSLIKLLNCLWLNCHREDLRKLANTSCYVSFIYRVGTVHKTYRFFIFPFADAQPPRHSLSLLSSSSLPFQLINFLFRRLSPVSSIAPFLYSHLMPFLPLLFTLCVILTLTQLPIFMFLASKHPWKAFSFSQHCSSHENRPTDICLFLPRLQFCPLLFPPFPSSSFIPPFLCHILPLNLFCARGDCNVCQCTPSGALSRSHPLHFSPGAPDWGLSAQPSGWGSSTERSTLETISGLCPRYWEIINAPNEITNQMECDGSLS